MPKAPSNPPVAATPEAPPGQGATMAQYEAVQEKYAAELEHYGQVLKEAGVMLEKMAKAQRRVEAFLEKAGVLQDKPIK